MRIRFSSTALIRTAAGVLCAAGLVVAVSPVRSDAATLDGSATPVVGDGDTTKVLAGQSDTPFYMMLSPSLKNANGMTDGVLADCSGDTATGSTNVRTYLIHSSDTVTTEDFGQNEPGVVPSMNPTLALFDTGGNIQTDGNTGNTGAGTGQIIIPTTLRFSFGQIVSGNGGGIPLSTLLYGTGGATGSWKGGFACFKAGNPGVVTDYWQFTVTFTKTTANPTAGDAEGFSWAVVPDGTAVGSTTTTPTAGATTTTAAPTGTTPTTLPGTSTTVIDPNATTTTTTTVSSTVTPPLTDSSGAVISSGSGGGGSSGSGGGGSGNTLAATGSPVRRSINIGLVMMIAGISVLLLSARRSRSPEPAPWPGDDGGGSR